MKTIIIAGNVGKDAATRDANGTPVTSWSVAVEERNGQDKRTIWFDCSMWGTRGEKVGPYIRKGGRVAVAGELSTREYEGKTYLTVRVDQLTLLGDGGRSDAPREERQERASAPSIDLDDTIPFAPEWR